MTGWGGGPSGSDPRGTDPWGRPVQGQGQGGQSPWGPTPPGGQPVQPGGWQTQPAPNAQPGAGQPGGWQTQTGGQPVPGQYPPRPAGPPPSGWGPPPSQGQVPPGWNQQPPPGYRPPSQGSLPPAWGAPPQQQGWGQQPGQPGQQGQIPTWAQPPQGAAPPVWARTQPGVAAPPGQWGAPSAPAPSAAWTLTGGPDPDAFPVRLIFDETQGIGRLWGIPGIGVAVRMLLLIPHFIVLWLLGIAAAVLMYFTWIPVLFTGRQADLVYQIVGGYLRWTTRLTSYLYLLNSGYPPFSLAGEDDYRVRVEIDPGQRINRFWGIPLVGIVIRAILLIPHMIALFFVGIAAIVLLLFSWVPVLVLGRQAQLVYSVVGGWMRWTLRVTTYLWLLHDRYPPFSLGNEEADRYTA